jgi:hypothetical protein
MSEAEPFFALKMKVPCRGVCGEESCGEWMMPKPGKHAKHCVCQRCKKGNNRTNGLAKQVEIAKTFAVPGVSTLHPGNEENWRAAIRMEVKSGMSECGPLMNFYRRTRAQSDLHKALGDIRAYGSIGVVDDLSVMAINTLEIPRFIYDGGAALGYWEGV